MTCALDFLNIAVAYVEDEHFLLNFYLVYFGRGMSGIDYSQGKKFIIVTLVAYFQELVMVTPKNFRAARAIFRRAALVSSMGRLESQNRGPRVSTPESNF
jgi:hypothetical protein